MINFVDRNLSRAITAVCARRQFIAFGLQRTCCKGLVPGFVDETGITLSGPYLKQETSCLDKRTSDSLLCKGAASLLTIRDFINERHANKLAG